MLKIRTWKTKLPTQNLANQYLNNLTNNPNVPGDCFLLSYIGCRQMHRIDKIAHIQLSIVWDILPSCKNTAYHRVSATTNINHLLRNNLWAKNKK